MSFTAIGIIIIALAVLALSSGKSQKPWLLLLACLPLQAATVLSLGDENGVDPRFFLIPIACFWPVVSLLLRKGFAERDAGEYGKLISDLRLLKMSLWVLLLWASISTVFFPVIFNWVIVAPYHAVETSPLARSSSNWKHLIYLAMCILAFRVMLFELSHRTMHYIKIFSRVFLYSLWAAALIILWHACNLYFGVPFPASFFQNNPGAVLISGGSIRPDLGAELLFRRPSGTFSEPSYASLYLTALVWLVVAQITVSRQKLRPILSLLFLLPIIVLSTATTAYISCVAAVCIPLVYRICFRGVQREKNYSSSVANAVIITLAGFLVLLAYVKFSDSLGQLFTLMVTNKFQADSSGRLAGGMFAMTVFTSTMGLGAGLGTNQSVTLGTYVAASLGVPGMVLLGTFVWSSAKLAYAGIKKNRDLALDWAVVGGQLVVGLIGVPTLLEPSVWIILSLALAKTLIAIREPVATLEAP